MADATPLINYLCGVAMGQPSTNATLPSNTAVKM